MRIMGRPSTPNIKRRGPGRRRGRPRGSAYLDQEAANLETRPKNGPARTSCLASPKPKECDPTPIATTNWRELCRTETRADENDANCKRDRGRRPFWILRSKVDQAMDACAPGCQPRRMPNVTKTFGVGERPSASALAFALYCSAAEAGFLLGHPDQPSRMPRVGVVGLKAQLQQTIPGAHP